MDNDTDNDKPLNAKALLAKAFAAFPVITIVTGFIWCLMQMVMEYTNHLVTLVKALAVTP